MGILTTLAKKKVKAAVKKKADKKIAATIAAKKKAVAANKKKAKATAEKKKADLVKKDYAVYVKQHKADEKAFAKKANTDSAKEEAYESSRSMASTKDRTSVAAKKPKTKPKKTFESELRELKSKAMTDANRQREASKLAVKYGRTIRMNGKTFGPKKGPPISRERIPGVKRNKKGEIIDREGT
jgi:ABC-type Na+ efflux pump permease subunit